MEKSMGESVHRRHVPEPGADVVVDESDLGERHGSIPSVGNGAGHAGPSSSSTRLDGPNAIQGSNLIEKSPLGILSVMKGTQIYVIVLFVAWNLFSSLAQNTTKSILSEVSLSLTVTLLQFVAIISFCVVLMKASLVPTQPLTWGVAKKILPLSAGHFLAHVLTQLSLAAISVSFAQTVKATSPIFTLVMSRYFLKHKYDSKVALSLVPIVVGVTMSSAVEIEFNWWGLLTALGSTFLFVCQNLYSKYLFTDNAIDHVNLLCYTSLFAMILLIPPWMVLELPEILQILPTLGSMWKVLSLNGFCHFMQSFSAFTLLSLVSPLGYSIANTFKRVFVILSSIVYFGNPVLPLNYFGILLACGGVLLYNKAMLDKKKREKRSKHKDSNPTSNSSNGIHNKHDLNGNTTNSNGTSPSSIGGAQMV